MTSPLLPGDRSAGPQLDYVGVHTPCGCMSAWLSGDHATQKDIRDFYREMADSGREVRRVTTEEARAALRECEHCKPGAAA